jgi:hypothetical protein
MRWTEKGEEGVTSGVAWGGRAVVRPTEGSVNFQTCVEDLRPRLCHAIKFISVHVFFLFSLQKMAYWKQHFYSFECFVEITFMYYSEEDISLYVQNCYWGRLLDSIADCSGVYLLHYLSRHEPRRAPLNRENNEEFLWPCHSEIFIECIHNSINIRKVSPDSQLHTMQCCVWERCFVSHMYYKPVLYRGTWAGSYYRNYCR